MTIFLVEQNAFHALKLAHRAYVMVSGIITMSGTGKELLADRRSGGLPGRRTALRRQPTMPCSASTTVDDNGLWIFLLVTSSWAAGRCLWTGRPCAQTWRPVWHIPLYMLALAAAVRFCHFALFDEPLLSLHSFVVDSAFIAPGRSASAIGSCARARWCTQYGWLYRRTGLLQLADPAE